LELVGEAALVGGDDPRLGPQLGGHVGQRHALVHGHGADGGASVFYSDAVIKLGGTLANYSEYSGDPPSWAVEALTDKICSLPGIKNIIVGGAIANFTDVKATFTGIISAFRKAKKRGQLDGVKIWVRRGGPNEQAGLESMRELKNEGFDIEVFDRYTPLTDIVNMALAKPEGQ